MYIGEKVERINNSMFLDRNAQIDRALSIQSKAISLLWGLEQSLNRTEDESIKRRALFETPLNEKNEENFFHSIESENHLSVKSNHLDIDRAIEITDFVKSKVLKQEKVESISHNSSRASLSFLATSLLQ